MKKTEECRNRAAECRAQASTVPAELKQHYLDLAGMWDKMAEERVIFFVPKDQKDA